MRCPAFCVLSLTAVVAPLAAYYWSDSFCQVYAELKRTWGSFDEEFPEFRGMEYWTPHQLKLCNQSTYLTRVDSSLACHRVTNNLNYLKIEVLNEYPLVALIHEAMPARLLRFMAAESLGTQRTRDLFTPDKLTALFSDPLVSSLNLHSIHLLPKRGVQKKLQGLLSGARVVHQRHIGHRQSPEAAAFTAHIEAITGLDLDYSSREWKLVSYGAGFHHSLHTDYLVRREAGAAKALSVRLAEAFSFFRRRCLANTRGPGHFAVCCLKTLLGGARNLIQPTEVENESVRTVEELGNRAIAIVVYTNEAYEGGATIFPALNITVRGKLGDVLVFPISKPDGGMDTLMMHAACPLVAGRKVVSVFMPRERGQELRLLCPWDVNAYDAASFVRGPLALAALY